MLSSHDNSRSKLSEILSYSGAKRQPKNSKETRGEVSTAHKRVHSWHGPNSNDRSKELKIVYGVAKHGATIRSESENSKTKAGSTQNSWFINSEDRIKKERIEKMKELEEPEKQYTVIPNTKILLFLSGKLKIKRK